MQYEQQKRILDIVVASALMLIFLPIWIIIPILIFLTSGAPVIFRHKRVGRGGEEFYLYKFRSMVKNADEILYKYDKKLLAEFKKNDWKIENDPRITPLGKALRALTIDEFPQLYNVLRGEMSMIGPRPYVKKELEEQTKRYPKTKKHAQDAISVKPGVSGPWQTSGRNEVPFPARVKLDAEYAKKQSIIEDIKIILRTPKAMISRW